MEAVHCHIASACNFCVSKTILPRFLRGTLLIVRRLLRGTLLIVRRLLRGTLLIVRRLLRGTLLIVRRLLRGTLLTGSPLTARHSADRFAAYCAANTNGTFTVVVPLERGNDQVCTRRSMQLARPR